MQHRLVQNTNYEIDCTNTDYHIYVVLTLLPNCHMQHLHYTTLHYTTLHHTALHYTTLHRFSYCLLYFITLFIQGPEKATVEVVCQAGATVTITSGGGFSYYYPQPSFQKEAVDGYFKQCSSALKTPYKGYNSEGRAYPDISLAGLDYQYYIGGVESLYSGTGAAATVVAGIFSNINAARNSVGKGSIGWVNPALYMNHTSYVKDIISGSNKCGGSSTVGTFKCCPHGFSATPGWDPTTGLGSLNYQKMKRHFLLLGEIKSVTSAPSSSKPTSRPTSSPSSTLTPKPSRSSPSSTPSVLLQASSSKSSSTRLQGT